MKWSIKTHIICQRRALIFYSERALARCSVQRQLVGNVSGVQCAVAVTPVVALAAGGGIICDCRS